MPRLPSRRSVLSGLAVSGVMPHLATAKNTLILTPEMFGAKGDGRTNDSAAFSELARQINMNGGGIIRLRKATYVVGQQARPGRHRQDWALEPRPLLHIADCTNDVVIEGANGCLQSAPGLRFGTFDRNSLAISRRGMPNYKADERATPYSYMLLIERCSGSVMISDLELDGRIQSHVIGGPYGDVGWQIPATGLFLRDNSGREVVTNLHSHHHAQDGIIIDGLDGLETGRTKREFVNVSCNHNGRQGLSIVGGRGYRFRNCRFEHTGRAGLASQPGAGVDIEAEGKKTIRNVEFLGCSFNDNFGCAVIADSGDCANVTFERCTFRGTTAWSAWPAKPGFVFRDCEFQGAVVRTFPSEDERLATQFLGCTFLDFDPKAPGAKLYLGEIGKGPIVNANIGTNVLFDHCAFQLRGGGTLPWSVKARYRDCVMQQRSSEVSYPRGEYLGLTTIIGAAVVVPSTIVGSIILNGRSVGS
jgi:hypothetical protein